MVSAPPYANSSQRISVLLQQFLEQHQEDEVCLQDLLAQMGDRAFGPVLFLCALPEALPLPVAGISAVVAIPLMLVSTQLMLGFRQPWLPRWLLERRFKRQQVVRVVNKAHRPLERLERLLKPRWQAWLNPVSERLIGLLLLLLAVIVALPIPFGNMLPAIAIVLICLGLIERDGLVIALSSVLIGVILVLGGLAIAAFLPLFPASSPQKS